MFHHPAWVATVATHQLPELSEQSKQEVFTIRMVHPVAQAGSNKSCSLSRNLSDSPSDLPAIGLGQQFTIKLTEHEDIVIREKDKPRKDALRRVSDEMTELSISLEF